MYILRKNLVTIIKNIFIIIIIIIIMYKFWYSINKTFALLKTVTFLLLCRFL